MTLKGETLCCTDTPAIHYQTMPPNIPEQRRQTHFNFTFLRCNNAAEASFRKVSNPNHGPGNGYSDLSWFSTFCAGKFIGQ